MSKDKDIFAKGIAQLRAEGFVPAQQQAVEATFSDKNDFINKMANKWKKVNEAVDANSPLPSTQPQPRVQSAPPKSSAATMDLPAGLRLDSGYSEPMGVNENFDPREDDAYFERLQQQKLQQVRRSAQPQPQQQQIQEQYQAPRQVIQSQAPVAPLNEQYVQQIAEGVLKDVVLNLYIEEKIRKVLTEGLSDDRIAQVVKQTIKELRDGAPKKK
jgi:hypothetical protein